MLLVSLLKAAVGVEVCAGLKQVRIGDGNTVKRLRGSYLGWIVHVLDYLITIAHARTAQTNVLHSVNISHEHRLAGGHTSGTFT